MVQADPEGFIRSLDADTGPDADNPRACGVALLLCMLRKGSSHVAEAMLSYVTHLQVCSRPCPLFCPLPLPCLLFLPFAFCLHLPFGTGHIMVMGLLGVGENEACLQWLHQIWPDVSCSTSILPLAPKI